MVGALRHGLAHTRNQHFRMFCFFVAKLEDGG